MAAKFRIKRSMFDSYKWYVQRRIFGFWWYTLDYWLDANTARHDVEKRVQSMEDYASPLYYTDNGWRKDSGD